MVSRASSGELDSILPRGFQGVKGSKVKSKYNSGELDSVLGQGPDASYQKYIQDRQKEEEKKRQQATELKQAQDKKKKEDNDLVKNIVKTTVNLSKPVGKGGINVFANVGEAAVDSARNAVAQAQMGQRGAGDERSQKLIEARNKFAEEDFKAGKITKQQRDKMVAENSKRLRKTQDTTKKLEKEFGRKYDQDQGAIDAVSTIVDLEGAPAIIKGAAKVGTTLLGKMAPKAAKESVGGVVDEAVKARLAKKVEVTGESAGLEKVGVKTPVRPGIRQESTTYNVTPRTPQKISGETYTKRFNKISKAYDKEVKSLESKPALTQEAGLQKIDEKYKSKIDQLDNDFNKGVLPEKTVVSKVDKSISKAEPTIGGAPTEGVNVRSSLYKPEPKKLRITQREATQKLEKAGYTTDESKAILSDALSNKGLSMPGSPKKIGYDEQSVIESARNYDGENLPEPSNLTPLKSVDANAPKGTSKLGQSVLNEGQQAKVISKTEAEAADLPQYNKANMKEQAQYATELIKSDPQVAIDIAMGRKAPPEHILSQTVFNAVEAHAKAIGGEDGANLLRNLAKSKQVGNLTKMGQEIRAAAERDPHSPVNLMNEVRLKRAEKLKSSGKSLSKEQKADAKLVKDSTPKVKKEDWDSFVKGITC